MMNVSPPPVERKTVNTVIRGIISRIKWWFYSFYGFFRFTKSPVLRFTEGGVWS